MTPGFDVPSLATMYVYKPMHGYNLMQAIMSNYVGIVRSNLSLERALRRLSIIYEETEELHNKIKPNRELCELRNMIAVAYLVIKQGSALKESVGCHYNSDYPKPDNK